MVVPEPGYNKKLLAKTSDLRDELLFAVRELEKYTKALSSEVERLRIIAEREREP